MWRQSWIGANTISAESHMTGICVSVAGKKQELRLAGARPLFLSKIGGSKQHEHYWKS
jgi:hypothetical protein